MSTQEVFTSPSQLPELRWLLAQVRERAIRAGLPPLLLGGVALLGFSGHLGAPESAEWLGILLWLLAALVWGAGKLSTLASGWALALGYLAADLLVVSWLGVEQATFLLVLPAPLAASTVSVPAGVAIMSICTALLAWAPLAVLPAEAALRIVTALGVWGVFGLVWLMQRPLFTALQWSWSSYERSHTLLERARDYQVQLKQTLKDLADANLQLTRLNRLAQALRQEAENARAAKQQFVANVSHELRTPLNMIIGFSEMITQAPEVYGSAIPPALLADLEIILRNSQHLSDLIDDVLDLSQIEARRMALTSERVVLAEIIEAAVTAVRPLFESKGLYLRMHVPPGLTALCDRTRIREVVLNLLSNAGRFTERGGVEVRAWQEGHQVVVSVADTGPGIAAEDREKLFQPFQQLDGSVRRRYGGTGLGLAISKHFVELHGGTMWLESEKGRGTTLYFRLPAEPTPSGDESATRWLATEWEYGQRSQPSLAPVPVVRPRFVVLDPAGSLRRLVARYLPGIEVAAVTDEEEAVRELARVPSQALLVNDSSVAQALQRLSASSALPRGTPAIICSVPGVPEAADALGVSDYLVKPVSRADLFGALERLGIHGGTVLVVDDEPEALRLFWRMLASAGDDYTVLTASNGEEALRVLRRKRPDVILLDLVMPGMDGFRLLELWGEDPGLRGIPVVVISARDPAGQPIVSNAVSVTQGGGLACHQVLACIDAIWRVLAPGGEPAGPVPPQSPRG